MNYQKLRPEARLELPRGGDCGIDLRLIGEAYILPDVIFVADTGIAVEIPSGYFGQVLERSSIGRRGIALRGGVIDSSYRGEIKVMLHNLSGMVQHFDAGHKIAQLVLIPYHVPANLIELPSLSDTERGVDGFGSTDE